MYKICMCGHFGGENSFNDGQTIKTKNLYRALEERYGKESILIVDTYNWKKHPIKFFSKCKKALQNSENLVMLPAHNGVKVFIPLYIALNKLYKRNIFYVVVGGWLPDMLQKKTWLKKSAKKLTKIFVETTKMKQDLKVLDLNNVEILVNFKYITPIKIEEMKCEYKKPYKLCTFSRVMEEKGIEDAISVVKRINDEVNDVVYTLDIYGPIDKEYSQRFEELKKSFPEYINYIGCVDSDKSVEVLKEYYLLLFPTKFKTEGIPGTIIDALATGLPIVASKWDNYLDILVDGENSFLFDMYDVENLKNILSKLIDDSLVIQLKRKTLETVNKFNKDVAMKVFFNNIENKE